MNRFPVIARLKQFEGCINHMYRCTGGEVTVGIGHALLSPASASNLTWQINGAPAPPGRVQSDYQAVAAAPLGQVANAYQHLTQCRMGDTDVEALVAADVTSFEAQLLKVLPNWHSYPSPAQEALFDMAFNLGIGGLFKFPTLLKAVNESDWATAAAQCHRRGIQDARNQATAQLFRRAGSAASA
jgi:GH24 family phage-related lysozyme (muramidase)